jgi:hypothetical protein
MGWSLAWFPRYYHQPEAEKTPSGAVIIIAQISGFLKRDRRAWD